MGYILNELANLPIDDKVRFYIFVINGEFVEPLYRVVEENFARVASSIGSEAVIAMGTDKRDFTVAIARKYLGVGNSDSSFTKYLPALLITDTHPDQLRTDSLRLVVPLRDAEPKFGDWHQFFEALAQFVRGQNKEFLERFQVRESLLKKVSDVLELKPNAFGIGININAFIDRLEKSRTAARADRPFG